MTARHCIRSLLALPAAAALLALGACASPPGAGSDYPETPDSFATFAPVDFEGPEQPPYPANRELSEEERLAVQQRSDDSTWHVQVASRFPDAVRPEVAVERYVEGDELYAVLADCYEEAGVPYDLASGGNGIGLGELTEEQAVAAYVCGTQFQDEPWPGLSAEQMGWYYDYWLTSLIPCYEANGFALDDDYERVPNRDEYIVWRTSMQESIDGIAAEGVAWNPVFDTDALSPWDLDALEAACVFDPLYEG